MDTMAAFLRGQANQHRELMVFDWDRAAELIRQHKPERASAGLSGDWEWTGDEIYRDGEPVEDGYTFLASTWAAPEIDLDGWRVDCYRMQSETPGWGSGTTWPDSAKQKLEAD